MESRSTALSSLAAIILLGHRAVRRDLRPWKAHPTKTLQPSEDGLLDSSLGEYGLAAPFSSSLMRLGEAFQHSVDALSEQFSASL